MQVNKKLVPYTIGALALIIILVITMVYLQSRQKLTITYGSSITNLTTEVYRVPNRQDLSDADVMKKGNFVTSVNASKTLTLKKGSYVITASTNKDYEPYTNRINLQAARTITVNPPFTSAKLDALLRAELPAIQKAIANAFPNVISNFRVNDGKLFLQGDWYGTTLAAKASPEQYRTQYFDIFRIVAHKEQNAWKIVTVPPELIISKITYPNIPVDVLKQVNRLPLTD